LPIAGPVGIFVAGVGLLLFAIGRIQSG
jgi:hypothetical protein